MIARDCDSVIDRGSANRNRKAGGVSPADLPLIVRMDTVHNAITEPVRRLEVFTEPVARKLSNEDKAGGLAGRTNARRPEQKQLGGP